GRFLVVGDLLGGRLADVDDGGAVEVPRLDLGRRRGITRGGGHDAPPAASPRRPGRVGRAGRRGVAEVVAAVRAGVEPRSPPTGPGRGELSTGESGEGVGAGHEGPPRPGGWSHHAANASRASTEMVTGPSGVTQVVASPVVWLGDLDLPVRADQLTQSGGVRT